MGRRQGALRIPRRLCDRKSRDPPILATTFDRSFPSLSYYLRRGRFLVCNDEHVSGRLSLLTCPDQMMTNYFNQLNLVFGHSRTIFWGGGQRGQQTQLVASVSLLASSN